MIGAVSSAAFVAYYLYHSQVEKNGSRPADAAIVAPREVQTNPVDKPGDSPTNSQSPRPTEPATHTASMADKQHEASIALRHAESGTPTPIEASLLIDGALDNRATGALLKSQSGEFAKFIETLRDQAGGSPLAADVGNLYGDFLGKRVAGAGNATLRLNDFACGRTLCAVSASSVGDDGTQAWEKVLDAEGSPPIYLVVAFDVKEEGRPTEHRIIFSTDPNAAGIAITAPNR